MNEDKFDKHYKEVIQKASKPIEEGGFKWWDISEARVYEAIRYLRIRGLIITHPSSILIRFK